MAITKLRAVLAVAASALVVVGCSTETQGTPTAGPPPSAGTSAQPSSSGVAGTNPEVRKVANPLDTEKFEAAPCGLVPKPVLAELRYPEPGKATPSDGAGSSPYCHWNGAVAGRGLMVTVQTANRDGGIGGLPGLYTGHDSGQLPFLEKAPDVGGFQAVYADRQDRRGRGACNLHVGIADDLDFSVATQGYEGAQDSCAAAQDAAAAVIDTLKEA